MNRKYEDGTGQLRCPKCGSYAILHPEPKLVYCAECKKFYPIKVNEQ